MIFHDNRLLADDSQEISYLIFFRKLDKMSQNLVSAAVVIHASRVSLFFLIWTYAESVSNLAGRFEIDCRK